MTAKTPWKWVWLKSQDSSDLSHFRHPPVNGYIIHTRIENQPTLLESISPPSPSMNTEIPDPDGITEAQLVNYQSGVRP